MNVTIRDLLILSSIPGIGPARLRALIHHFKDSSAVAHATPRELIAVEGVERKTALTITGFFRDSGASRAGTYADGQIARLHKVSGHAVTFWDKSYPSLLKRIYDPPVFLFVRGDFQAQDNASVAVVGTRSPSRYGLEMCEHMAAELARLGITVVSGLARGVDTCAHGTALKGSSRTVAVIGSGVDVIYPPENRALAERISQRGAVVSEFPMGAKPDAVNFPRRNRIISGMSLGTLVVETGINGGAMITAAMALDQNREVFAIPGPVDRRRRSGTNVLIREGKATLVETAEDILTELAPQLRHLLPAAGPTKSPAAPDLSLFERKVYDALEEEPVHIDLLAAKAGLSTSDALVHLLSLEFKGAVRQRPGKLFVRV